MFFSKKLQKFKNLKHCFFSRKDGVERAGEGQTYLLGMGMVEEHERLGSVRA